MFWMTTAIVVFSWMLELVISYATGEAHSPSCRWWSSSGSLKSSNPRKTRLDSSTQVTTR